MLKEVLCPYSPFVCPIASAKVTIRSNAVEVVAKLHPRETVRAFVDVGPFAMKLTGHIVNCFECYNVVSATKINTRDMNAVLRSIMLIIFITKTFHEPYFDVLHFRQMSSESLSSSFSFINKAPRY